MSADKILIIDPKTSSLTLMQGSDIQHETIFSAQRTGFEWREFIETLGEELLNKPEYSPWSSGPWTLTTSPKSIEQGEIVNGKKLTLENRATYKKNTDECVNVYLSDETFIVKVNSITMEGSQALLANDNNPSEEFNLGEILTTTAKLLRRNNLHVSGKWEGQFSIDEDWNYVIQFRAAVMPDFMEPKDTFYSPSPEEMKPSTPKRKVSSPQQPVSPPQEESSSDSEKLSKEELRNIATNKIGCAWGIIGFIAALIFNATACSPEPEKIETVVTKTVTPAPITTTTTKTMTTTELPPPPEPEPEIEEQAPPLENIVEPAPVANIAPIPEHIPPQPVAPPPAQTNVYFANCSAAREAGAAPLYSGTPGYRPQLDRDGDGVACE